MSDHDKIVERDFAFPAAGSTWTVPEYSLTRMRDGTLVVAGSEFRRIHLAIASVLCTQASLTHAEIEFLRDVADAQDLVHAADFAARLFTDGARPTPLARMPQSTATSHTPVGQPSRITTDRGS